MPRHPDDTPETRPPADAGEPDRASPRRSAGGWSLGLVPAPEVPPDAEPAANVLRLPPRLRVSAPDPGASPPEVGVNRPNAVAPRTQRPPKEVRERTGGRRGAAAVAPPQRSEAPPGAADRPDSRVEDGWGDRHRSSSPPGSAPPPCDPPPDRREGGSTSGAAGPPGERRGRRVRAASERSTTMRGWRAKDPFEDVGLRADEGAPSAVSQELPRSDHEPATRRSADVLVEAKARGRDDGRGGARLSSAGIGRQGGAARRIDGSMDTSSATLAATPTQVKGPAGPARGCPWPASGQMHRRSTWASYERDREPITRGCTTDGIRPRRRFAGDSMEPSGPCGAWIRSGGVPAHPPPSLGEASPPPGRRPEPCRTGPPGPRDVAVDRPPGGRQADPPGMTEGGSPPGPVLEHPPPERRGRRSAVPEWRTCVLLAGGDRGGEADETMSARDGPFEVVGNAGPSAGPPGCIGSQGPCGRPPTRRAGRACRAIPALRSQPMPSDIATASHLELDRRGRTSQRRSVCRGVLSAREVSPRDGPGRRFGPTPPARRADVPFAGSDAPPRGRDGLPPGAAPPGHDEGPRRRSRLGDARHGSPGSSRTRARGSTIVGAPRARPGGGEEQVERRGGSGPPWHHDRWGGWPSGPPRHGPPSAGWMNSRDGDPPPGGGDPPGTVRQTERPSDVRARRPSSRRGAVAISEDIGRLRNAEIGWRARAARRVATLPHRPRTVRQTKRPSDVRARRPSSRREAVAISEGCRSSGTTRICNNIR